MKSALLAVLFTITAAARTPLRIDLSVEWRLAFGKILHRPDGKGHDRTRDISRQSAPRIAEAAKARGRNDDITILRVRRDT